MKKLLLVFLNLFLVINTVYASDGVLHETQKLYLNKKPVIINYVTVSPDSPYAVKLSYGGKTINTLQRVKVFAQDSGAYAAMNASFFKPSDGTPLGLSIVNKKLITGPLFQRSVFGVTRDGDYIIDKVSLQGNVSFGSGVVRLNNINQPVISKNGLFLFNSYWGQKSPRTSADFLHITVVKNRICKISKKSCPIPQNGYILVGHNSLLNSANIKYKEKVRCRYELTPSIWNKMKYAFAAGPYLVKNGKRLIDKQRFSDLFLWSKAPRSAIGIRKDGTVVLVTVDGRQKGISEGVTMTELANIMLKLKAYQAMNLDGGSSTQLIVKNKLVNRPSNKVGARVTNAIVIMKKRFH